MFEFVTFQNLFKFCASYLKFEHVNKPLPSVPLARVQKMYQIVIEFRRWSFFVSNRDGDETPD